MSAITLATNNYMAMLNTLSNDAKWAIINALTKSMETRRKPSQLQSLFGVWQDSRTAEDVITDIRRSRMTGTRHLESFE